MWATAAIPPDGSVFRWDWNLVSSAGPTRSALVRTQDPYERATLHRRKKAFFHSLECLIPWSRAADLLPSRTPMQPRKPLWFDGLFLQPHHLQRQGRYHERLLARRLDVTAVTC